MDHDHDMSDVVRVDATAAAGAVGEVMGWADPAIDYAGAAAGAGGSPATHLADETGVETGGDGDGGGGSKRGRWADDPNDLPATADDTAMAHPPAPPPSSSSAAAAVATTLVATEPVPPPLPLPQPRRRRRSRLDLAADLAAMQARQAAADEALHSRRLALEERQRALELRRAALDDARAALDDERRREFAADVGIGAGGSGLQQRLLALLATLEASSSSS
ncbi:hypothetical protein HK405_004237 [Cladochytrium tenue]|nr:hypothetical protein HK405_004237 [Cladochytrium tenue]